MTIYGNELLQKETDETKDFQWNWESDCTPNISYPLSTSKEFKPANLKIFLFLFVCLKTMIWRYWIPNPKDFRVI